MRDDKKKWRPIEDSGEGRERFATRSTVRYGHIPQASKDAKAQRVDMGPSTDVNSEGRERFATRSVVRCGPTRRASEGVLSIGVGGTSALLPYSESNSGSSSARAASSEGNETKRLRLEHTFVQGCENELARLLRLMQRQHGASPTTGHRTACIISTATAINLLLSGHRTEDSRLGEEMLRACIDIQESPAWVRRHPQDLTPLRVLKTLQEPGNISSRGSETGQPSHLLHFTLGPLAGKKYSLEEVRKIPKTAFGCFGPQFVSSMLRRADAYEKVRAAVMDADRSARLEELTSVTVESSCLVFTLTFNEYDDSYPKPMMPSAPNQDELSASDWGALMAAICLNHEQLQQCLQLRQSLYEDQLAGEVGTSCMEDLLQDLLTAAETSDQAIVDTVNIIQQAELRRRAREMKVAMQLWYSILTPQQHALLGAMKQFEYLKRYTGSLKEWLPVYYKCFTSESGWMDAHVPDDGR